jgi:aminopeptidase N
MCVRQLIRGAVLLGSLTVSAASQETAPEAFVVRDAKLDLTVDYASKQLAGTMTLEMENWTGKPAASVSLLLHRLMEASRVSDAAGGALVFTQDVQRFRDDPIRQVTRMEVKLPRAVAPGARTTVRIDYAGYVTPYTEVGWLYVRDHVDTAFTIIRSDALAFPVIGGLDDAANRRAPHVAFTYDASIRVPSKYLVATGGIGTRTQHDDGSVTWRYRSGRPSPFLNVAIAPFDTASAGGVRVFYFPADSAGATRLLRGARAALDTLKQRFGPLQTQANLTITEIPDGWGSQADFVGGIIQSAAAFRDVNRVGELYHELSHLWNAVDNDNPSPRWNEGLASFLEDLLRERIDGWAKRQQSDSMLVARVKRDVATSASLRTTPFIDYGKQGMTGNSYSVGNLMFAVLYELIGDDEFNKVVGGYYQRFAAGGTTRDFAAFAKRTASRDLTRFFDDWMFTTRWTETLAGATSIRAIVDRYRG